jgi:hypothetical protein
MGNLITTEAIPGCKVYGVQQVQYAVGGDSGKDFTTAVACAAFKEAAAIEAVCSGYSEVVKARQKKVEDLGEVLALLARANAQFDSKAESTDKITVDRANWIKSICSYYEIELKWDGNQMTYGDMQKSQTEIEYQMDKEDNNLEQDMVSLQSYISKRDNAYTNAAKVVKKTLAAGASTIANIGS